MMLVFLEVAMNGPYLLLETKSLGDHRRPLEEEAVKVLISAGYRTLGLDLERIARVRLGLSQVFHDERHLVV